MRFMLNSRSVSTDIQQKTPQKTASEILRKSQTAHIIQFWIWVISFMLIVKGLERSWCVTSKNACSSSPLRLNCMKVHFTGCDAALKGFTDAPDPLLFPQSLHEAHTAREHYRADTRMAPSDVKRVKTYWTGKSHQHRSSRQQTAAALSGSSPPPFSSFPFPFPFFFFPLIQPISRRLSPSLCETVDESAGRFAPLHHGSCYAVWL